MATGLESGSANGSRTSSATVAIRLSNRNSKYGLPEDMLGVGGSTLSSRLLIPQDWKRYQLSELVNRLVRTERPTPFEFIIDGQPLGGHDLSTFLRETGSTGESVLQVDYLEIARPPLPAQEFVHDDWISSIDAESRPGKYLTGSYDGLVRVFSDDSSLTGHCKPAATGPILATKWLPPCDYAAEWRIATAGRSGQIMVFSEDNLVSENAPKPVLTLSHHKQSVSALSLSNTGGTGLLSGSWDGQIALWTTERPLHSVNGFAVNGFNRLKKRKKGPGAEETEGITKTSAATLQGHSSAITSLLPSTSDLDSTHPIPNTVFSTAQDGTVRTWDVETGTATNVRHSDRVPLAADLVQVGSSDQIVVGNSDRSITLYDLRLGTDKAPADSNLASLNVPMAHSSKVSCIRTGRHDGRDTGYTVLSAGYDGVVKAWDIRAIRATTTSALETTRRIRPLWSMINPDKTKGSAGAGGPAAKILALDWFSTDQEDCIVTGGESKVLQVSKRER